MRTTRRAAFTAAVVFLVACGGSKQQTQTGAAGTTGTGAAGATGAAGVTGAGGGAGIMGDAGVTGTGGITGAAGATGSAGASGAGGDAGAIGTAGSGGSGGTVGSAGMGDTGFGGRGGTVGTGGAVGTGGTAGTCATPVNCGALCGNGMRDTCTIQANGCPAIAVTEACDGADLGNASPSCAMQGYGSGSVACASNCTVDLSTCRACATDPNIKQCGAAPFTSAPRAAAMAGGFGEIGLAWMEIDASQRVSLDFARLSPTFNLLGTTRLRMPAVAENDSEMVAVAVAALPSGWVVVAYSPPEIFVHAVSALGDDLGRTVVERQPPEELIWRPQVAQRPDGGPLVYWAADDAWRAAVVAADGRSVSAPVDLLPAGNTMGGLASAAYVGDAFYVAVSIAPSFSQAELHLRRVETDGRATTMIQALPGVNAWNAALVTGANELRVMYAGPMPGAAPANTWGVMWQKVGATGDALSSPVVLGAVPPYSGPIQGVALGADTVVLIGRDNATSLFAARIGGDGGVITSPFRIMALPIGFYWADVTPGIVRVSSEAIVAWHRFAGIELARIAP